MSINTGPMMYKQNKCPLEMDNLWFNKEECDSDDCTQKILDTSFISRDQLDLEVKDDILKNLFQCTSNKVIYHFLQVRYTV